MPLACRTAVALALLGSASTLLAAAASPITGTWATDFGSVRLTEKQGEVTGSYDTDDGRITGRFDGQVIDGFWVESASDYTCDTPKMGSRYWGRIRFELNSAGTGWSGIWS